MRLNQLGYGIFHVHLLISDRLYGSLYILHHLRTVLSHTSYCFPIATNVVVVINPFNSILLGRITFLLFNLGFVREWKALQPRHLKARRSIILLQSIQRFAGRLLFLPVNVGVWLWQLGHRKRRFEIWLFSR